MNPCAPVCRTIFPVVFSSLFISSPLFAQITAVDDGSVGSPFVSSSEDDLLDTSGGTSVLTNDTGTISVFSNSALSTQGVPVQVNPDGTFTYDPTASAAAQALAGGASLIDTFTYTIVETPTLVDGVTLELDATAGTNNFVWTGLSAPVAATGTGLPDLIRSAHQMPNGGARNDFGQEGAYNQISASFEFWLKPDVVDANQVIFETGGTGTGSAVVINDDGTVAWVVRNGTIPIVQSTTALAAGQWYHIVATYDRNNPGTTDTLELFIDGVSEGTDTANNADNWSGGDDAGLGRRNNSTAADNTDVDGDGTNEADYGNFTGQFAVARFFSGKVLTPAEVISNRNAILTGVTDTATVTLEVTGVNDVPGVVTDVISSPQVLEDASQAFTTALLANDGPIGADATGVADLLLWNYDAAQSAGTGVWENIGTTSGASANWNLSGGVTLNGSPVTGLTGVTASYDFDGVDGAAVLAGSSPEAILGNLATTYNAALEVWVKPANLTQTATIVEMAGGTGSGIALDGNLLVAGSTGGGRVTYDLLADSQSLLGAGATAEYFQVMAVYGVELGSPELRLYVNGTLVGISSMGADWASTDGSGVGRFAGANVGGILNAAAGTAYDTYLEGSVAILRLYGADTPGFPVFGGYEARQNYTSVATGTELEGDTFSLAGIIDGAAALQGVGSPATLTSGAIVTLDNATGHFTYNPNGAYESLAAGVTTTDTFSYRISDTGGGTADGFVTVTITGKNDADNDTIEASEALVTNFKANQIVGNDEHALATSDAFFSVDAASVSGSTWTNIGSSGAAFDVNVASGTLINPPTLESNFGAIGAAFRDVDGDVASVQSIGTEDATFEVWFKPTPLQHGKQVLLESGGNGNGMSIVFDADANTVVFTIDGGDDATAFIKATVSGVVTGEFNQLIAVYDRDNPTVEDNLSLYLNSDASAVFDATVKGSGQNAAGLADVWSGSDGSGIGSVTGSAALNETLSNFLGDLSIVRIYSRKLSTVEMAANFDSVVQKIVNIEGGTSFTTALGATVTLNADGSFDYDATSLTTPIGDGNSDVDSFDYTISDGLGGFATATVSVNVTGVDVSFLAKDDDVSISENDSAMSFAVLGNDNFTTATVELESLESGYGTVFESGVNPGDLANALAGNWSYLWNAPSDWTGTSSVDASTGGFGVTADYEPLIWSGTQWTADGDDTTANNDPTGFLRLNGTGGHPGLGATTPGLNGNTQDRGPIAAYTIPSDGVYGIGNSILTRVSASAGTIAAAVYVDDDFVGSFVAGPGSSTSFDGNLGALTAGQTIYVGVSPDGAASADAFTWEFEILILPSEDYQLLDIIGSVSTDGTTITYDPSGNFEGLGVGQTVVETLTYTINDGSGGTSTASVNITVNGENDAPVGVPDFADTLENISVSGNVLTNDTDVDAGDSTSLVVSEVEGSAANVGVPVMLASGATVTVQTGGGYVYDPNGAFDFLDFRDLGQDSFTYLVQDQYGLDDTSTTTVTIDLTGSVPNNGQPTATNTTQTILYSSSAGGVLIDPSIAVGDPNDGITSLADATFLFDGAVSTFPGGNPDADNDFNSPAIVATDGFALKLAFLPTALDVASGITRVLYEYGGTSNGHGVYLYDGIPYLVVKMQGGPESTPAALVDNDWAGDTISIPLTAAIVPVGEATDISLIFTLDQVDIMVNGGAVRSEALLNRAAKTNWSGNLTVTIGAAGPAGNNGGSSQTTGIFAEPTFTDPEGPVLDCRFWNATAADTVIFDPEEETAILVINPADGALSVPTGASFDGTTWTYSGTPAQVTGALSLVEFQPNGTSPTDVSVDIRDGEENGSVPLTGTLTFQVATALEEWRFAEFGSFLDAGDSADDANTDFDLFSNLLEFAFGTDPKVADAVSLQYDGMIVTPGAPVVAIEFPGGGVDIKAQFMRRDDHGTAGSVSYAVEFSASLNGDWETSAEIPTVVADAGDYELVEIPYPLFIVSSGEKARFFRVVVTNS